MQSRKKKKKRCRGFYSRPNICEPECTSCISAEGSARVLKREHGILRCNLLPQNTTGNKKKKIERALKLFGPPIQITTLWLLHYTNLSVNAGAYLPHSDRKKKKCKMSYTCSVALCSVQRHCREDYITHDTMLTIVVFIEKLG